jgi:hypothetical protein
MSVIAILRQLSNCSSIILNMSKLYLLVILVSTALTTAQEIGVTKQFAGCYVLRVVAQHPASNRDYNVLPKRFLLTSHPSPYDKDSAGKIFTARSLDPKIRWDLSLSSWTVTDDGYLQISWSTGYVGYGVKLGWNKGFYRGSAHYWTDTDPQPLDPFTTRNSTPVRVDRVECTNSEK